MDATGISAIGTIVQAIVACLLLYITRQQRDISNNQTKILQAQINIALYERRFVIYQSLMTLISTSLRSGALANEDLTEFWRSSKEAKFLVDEEINLYIHEVQSRANKFVSLCNTEPRTSGPELEEWLTKIGKEKEFFEKAIDETTKRFEKYLGFKQVALK